MKSPILILTLLLWSSFQVVFAQTPKTHVCYYDGNNLKYDICIRANYQVAEAEKIIDNIVGQVGLKRNFIIVECPDAQNAIALNVLEGNQLKRVIVYDKAFLEKFKSSTKTDWAAISILAHEVGHHLNGHTLDANESNAYLKELEADEFSGFVLYQMGASLAEAKAALNSLTNPYGSSTHPPKKNRLEAVENGWNRARILKEGKKGENSTLANEWFNQGYWEKDNNKKIEYYSKAIRLKPDYYKAYYNRGLVKESLGLYDDALKDYDETLNIKPDALAYYSRAKVKSILKKQESALQDINATLIIEPNNVKYLGKRASIYLALNQYEKVTDDYSKIIELEPNDYYNYIQRADFYILHYSDGSKLAKTDYEKAIKVYEKYETTGSHKPDDFWYGHIYLRMGEYDKAIERFKKSLINQPNMTVHLLLGISYFRAKQYSKAISELENGIRLEKTAWKGNEDIFETYSLPNYQMLIAFCKVSLEKDEEALGLFKQCWNKAYIPSIRTFSTGFSNNEGWQLPYYYKGISLQALKKYDEAIALYSEAIGYFPDNSYYLNQKGIVYDNMSKHSLAIIEYSKALELYNEYVEVYNNRAYSYLQTGEYAKCIADCEKAYGLDPDYAYAYSNKGCALVKLGRYAEAIKSLEKSLSLVPDNQFAIDCLNEAKKKR